MRTAARRRKSPTRLQLDQELTSQLLEKGRDLVEEYAALCGVAPEAFPFERSALLDWYAEIKYKLGTRSRCSLCGAPVRRALPVVTEIDERTVMMHACLCADCLATQQLVSRRVEVCLGGRTPAAPELAA